MYVSDKQTLISDLFAPPAHTRHSGYSFVLTWQSKCKEYLECLGSTIISLLSSKKDVYCFIVMTFSWKTWSTMNLLKSRWMCEWNVPQVFSGTLYFKSLIWNPFMAKEETGLSLRGITQSWKTVVCKSGPMEMWPKK